MTELPRDQIYRCPNRQLAFALAICGAEFAEIQDGGPAANVYTPGFFQQQRFKAQYSGSGMTLNDAAIAMVKRGVPGHVTYAFKRSSIVERVIAAWDAMAKERTQADADGRAPEMPTIPVDLMAQTLFVAANSTEEFAKVPFVNRMMQLASTMDGRASSEPIAGTPGERTTIEGSGKVWSIFGSEKLREHLNV